MWTSVGMMIIPVLQNGASLAGNLPPVVRNCLTESWYNRKRAYVRIGMEIISFVSHAAVIVLILMEAKKRDSDRMKSLIIPVTLFGGFDILRTRFAINSQRSPTTVFPESRSTRYGKASFRLFVEAAIIVCVLRIHEGKPFWSRAAEANCTWDLAFRREGMQSNLYMSLTLIHIVAAFSTIWLAKFASSARMNLVGLCIPVIVFWPLFIGVADALQGDFPKPFRWEFHGFNLSHLSHKMVIVSVVLSWIAQVS